MSIRLYMLLFAGIVVFLTTAFITLYLKAVYVPEDISMQGSIYVEGCNGSALFLHNAGDRAVNYTLFEIVDYDSRQYLNYAVYVGSLGGGESGTFEIIDRLAPTISADLGSRGSGQYYLVSSRLPPAYFVCR